MTQEHLQIMEQAVEKRRKRALALAQASDAPACEALESLLRDPDESVHWFARHALDVFEERVEPRETSTVTLIDLLEQATDPDETARLCREILRRRETRVRDRMLPYLRHAQSWVRACAVAGFWGWDDPAVHRAVTDLGRDESARVRGQVLVHVILSDRPEARSLVLRMTQATVPAWAQLATIYGLGRANRSWTHRELTRLVSVTTLTPVARRLVREVVALPRGRSGLADAGRPREDSTVRTDLTRHLPPLPTEVAVLEALGDADVLVRVHALQNAARFPSAVMLPDLRSMADSDTDPLFLATLMITLGAVGGPDEAPTVRRFLDHPDPRVRANALQVLAAMPEPLPRAQVHALLVDDAPRVRVQAAAYLFRRDPEAALRHFRGLVLGNDNQAREGALYTLARLRDTRVLALFRQALLDRRRHVYRHAYEVLTGLAKDWTEATAIIEEYREGQIVGEVIDGEPVSALIPMLDSPTPSERIEAMAKLVSAEDPRVEMMLELNLAARDPEVRVKAAEVLSRRHVKQTLPRLHRQLGRIYAQQLQSDLAPVPRALALELAPLCENSPGEAGEGHGNDRAMELGQAIYCAFRDGIPLDAELVRPCQEIHSLVLQMESYSSRMQNGTQGRGAGVGQTTAAGADPRSEAVVPLTPEDRASYAYLGAGLVGATLLLMGVSFELGRRAGGSGSGAASSASTRGASNALFHVNGPR